MNDTVIDFIGNNEPSIDVVSNFIEEVDKEIKKKPEIHPISNDEMTLLGWKQGITGYSWTKGEYHISKYSLKREDGWKHYILIYVIAFNTPTNLFYGHCNTIDELKTVLNLIVKY